MYFFPNLKPFTPAFAGHTTVLFKEEDFLHDYKLTDSARHNLLIAIEAMLDIANHLIARHSFEIPKKMPTAAVISIRSL
jgi:uncharacterized protein YutE (UPF0331/DUF86 family)